MKLTILAIAIVLIVGLGTAFPNGILPIVTHTAEQGWTLPLVTVSIERPPMSSRRQLPGVAR